MKIATFNVNNINKRLPNLLAWLKASSPDIACIQELKCTDADFPSQAIAKAGYRAVWKGQKTWNGVALLSRVGEPMLTRTALPGDPSDTQSRYIEAAVQGILIGCLYLPNGNPQPGPKFDYKLAWMRRLEAHAARRLEEEIPFVMAGDYNIIPEPKDAKNPAAWVNDALFQPESRAAYRRLVNLGMTDAVRATTDRKEVFTFWDYQAGAWQRDHGIRIDFALLSPQAADRFRGVETHRDARDMDKPSDHVPVVVELDLEA